MLDCLIFIEKANYERDLACCVYLLLHHDDDSIFRPRSTLLEYWAVPKTPAGIVILSIATYNL